MLQKAIDHQKAAQSLRQRLGKKPRKGGGCGRTGLRRGDGGNGDVMRDAGEGDVHRVFTKAHRRDDRRDPDAAAIVDGELGRVHGP